MQLLLGIDIGTSATKALLCDTKGRVLATADSPHTLLTPKPGWTEQNPDQWWKATTLAVKKVLKDAKAKATDVIAIGLSGQMHGSVFLDKNNKVIRPALLWNDQRTIKQCADILETVGGATNMLDMVGNLPLTGYTVPKVLWLRDNEPKNYEKLKHLLLPKDYVRLILTGEHATDIGDASGTAMVDIKARAWSKAFVGKIDVDFDILPKIYESPEITGTLLESAAKQLGLKAGIPVVAGAGDVMSGAIGNGVVETGIINANLGTGGVMCAHADTPALDNKGSVVGRIATMCHAVPGKYVVFGCMLSAAGSMQWYGDELSQFEHEQSKKTKRNVFEIIDAQANQAPLGSEGLFFLPYLTGERCPHPDPLARGGWIGLTRRTNRAMMTRALMEGVTFGMTDMLNIMRDQMGIKISQARGTGGGSKSSLWRSIQADCYNAPLVLTNSKEGGAYGVALLAGVGAGVWKSVEEACRKTIKITHTTKPNKKNVTTYAKHHAVYAKLYESLKERYQEIAKL
jgi:xylulokinase